MDEKELLQVKMRFSQLLDSNGMRKTPERYEVLDAIYSSNQMLGVKELLSILKERRFRVSRATLYNVLGLLCEWQFAVKMQLKSGRVVYGKYEGDTPKLFIQCVKCNEMFEINSDIWSQLIDECGNKYGFSLENQKVLLQGLCCKCKKH